MISSGLDASSEEEYGCVSDDFIGTVVIYLDVVASAYITSSSGDVTADAGSNVTLTVTASGDPDNITYVWKKDGVIIPGETSNTLILNDISGDDIGQYECIPSNSVGSHNSSIIQVDINRKFQKTEVPD